MHAGIPPPRADTPPCAVHAGRYGQQASGMHPTGMQSCILDVFRNGVSTMTVKELFDFITDLSITEENLDEYLDRAMQISSQRSHHEVSEQEKIDEEVPLLPHFCRTCKKLF